MISAESSVPRQRVVVVGGGIAALECVLALHDLAADRLDVCLVAPDVFFALPPMAVARPFSRGTTGRLPLDRFMNEHGGRLHTATATRVDAPGRVVLCDDGDHERYDILVIAVGGRPRAPFPHALTFGLTEDRGALSDVLADFEAGHGGSLAFVVPDGSTWTLPLYELALMTAEELRSKGPGAVDIHIVTPESAPLEAFGPLASTGVAELLRSAGIQLHTAVQADVRRHGTIGISRDSQLHVDRIVALPTLAGPHLPGLPHDPDGFIPPPWRQRSCCSGAASPERKRRPADATAFDMRGVELSHHDGELRRPVRWSTRSGATPAAGPPCASKARSAAASGPSSLLDRLEVATRVQIALARASTVTILAVDASGNRSSLATEHHARPRNEASPDSLRTVRQAPVCRPICPSHKRPFLRYL